MTKDEVIQLSESLLVSSCGCCSADRQFIFRNEPGDQYLAAVSRFILNAYEFGDANMPDGTQPALIDGEGSTASHLRERSNSTSGSHNQPYLSKLFTHCNWRGSADGRRPGDVPDGCPRGRAARGVLRT